MNSMVEITVHKSNSSRTKIVHRIGNELPDAKTYAALILLNNHLFQQDKDYIAEKYDYLKRIFFSRNYLKKELKRCGKLTCKYCGKTDLIIEDQGMNVPYRNKATVDHVTPVSKGGAKYDKKNIVVACGRCNNTKGDMDVEVFLKRINKK